MLNRSRCLTRLTSFHSLKLIIYTHSFFEQSLATIFLESNMKPITTVILTMVFFSLSAVPASAHMAFKKELNKKYPDMKVTCNACHVKGKKKTERNDFGKLFHKQLKDKKLTEGFKSKKGAERKEYEKDVMVPEFKKAFEKIKKMKPKDKEQTYEQLIKAGEMPEITKKEEK